MYYNSVLKTDLKCQWPRCCQPNPSVQPSPRQTTEQGGTMLAVCLLSALLCSLVTTQSDSFSRPLVDTEKELTIFESCKGEADGTRCTKRCVHWTCDPKFARCYEGNCKRAGQHPCNTSPQPHIHPCCCGSCHKQMVNIFGPHQVSAKTSHFLRTTQRILSVLITSRSWPRRKRPRRAIEK